MNVPVYLTTSSAPLCCDDQRIKNHVEMLAQENISAAVILDFLNSPVDTVVSF